MANKVKPCHNPSPNPPYCRKCGLPPRSETPLRLNFSFIFFKNGFIAGIHLVRPPLYCQNLAGFETSSFIYIALAIPTRVAVTPIGAGCLRGFRVSRRAWPRRCGGCLGRGHRDGRAVRRRRRCRQRGRGRKERLAVVRRFFVGWRDLLGRPEVVACDRKRAVNFQL